MQFKCHIAILLFSLALASCSLNKSKNTSGGGFYGGDNAPSQTRDYDKIPDAVPKHEPLSKYGNNPYNALGKSYKPLKSSKGFKQKGTASWYGTKFHGRRTSSGETYDMWAMTAAHPTLPLPTYVRVTNLDTNKKIIVKVNDRGPFLHGRVIDLSFAAAHKLDIANKGTGRVSVEALDPDEYTAGISSDSALSPKPDLSKTIPATNVPVSGEVGGKSSNENYYLQVGRIFFYS